MTVSKPILLGVLCLGMLLGGVMCYLVVGPSGSQAADEASVQRATKESRKGRGPGGRAGDSLPPREASRELASWIGEADTEQGYLRIKELISGAAEWSAGDTMDQALLIENPYRRREVLQRLFRYWIGSDQEAALGAIAKLENVALRSDLYRDAMKWLAQDDPVAAIGLLEKRDNAQDHDLWSRSLANWASTDRDAAVARVLAIEEAGLRGQVLRSVAQRLAQSDLGKALAWAETLEGENGAIALAGVLAEAAGARPEAVAAHLEQVPPGRTRTELIGRAADEWAERDPDAALEWAETLDERERELAIGEIAERVLETDPERAQELADLIPDATQRGEIVQRIARLRAGVDIEEAIAWIGTLPSEDRAGAWEGTAREWARSDPRGAAEYAATVDDLAAQGALVAAASASWAQRDPAEAAEWAQTLAGASRSGAMNRIMESWAREDPAAAGDFAARTLDGDLQARTTRQIVGRWMREDMAEASAWIDALPDGQVRDGAVYTLVSSIERDYPDIALQWVDTIGDAERRADAERRIRRRLGE